MARFRLPHPLLLLLACVLVAALLTHLLPAGQYQRRDDPATGRNVTVAGTYHRVEAAPVGPFAAAVAVPRGFAAGAEVIVLVLLVGGAWAVVDKAGTLGAIVGWLVGKFGRRPHVIVTILCLAFAAGGALENMQKEIIPLIPVLLLLAARLGFDAVTVGAMSMGAAMVGSAFSPINPFQAGIALKLAQLPPLEGAGVRVGLLAAATGFWIWWTIRHAEQHRVPPSGDGAAPPPGSLGGRHGLILLMVAAPFAAYIVGVMKFGWGFNELSAAFLLAGLAIGLTGRLGWEGTIEAYL